MGIGVVVACGPSSSGTDVQPPPAQSCTSYISGIPGQWSALLAYYKPGGYPILLSQRGDEMATRTPFETWAWKCGWKREAGSNAQVWGYAMADDPAVHVTVLAGAKTWGWDGSAWQDMQIKPPANVGETSMVFDAARDVLLLVDTFPYGVHTWTFDGRSWKEVATDGPADEEGAALAYDPRSRTVLLFGGSASNYVGKQVTWSWDGSSWRLLTPDSSPPGGPAAMAYDEATRQMILVSFDLSSSGNRTWDWTGATWRRLGIDTPQFSPSVRMVYDSARQNVFFWDGASAWTYSGTWISVPVARN